jgi:hypothetical protein
MNEERIDKCITQAGRIEDLADAALSRAENNPVLQTLLSEIKEKAGVLCAVLHDVEVRT